MTAAVDTISALVSPDPVAVLIRTVLLGGTAAAAGLALARALTARRSTGDEPTLASDLSATQFQAMFADLSASVSAEDPASSADGSGADYPNSDAAPRKPLYPPVPREFSASAWVLGVGSAGACAAAYATGQMSGIIAAALVVLLIAVPDLIASRRRVVPSALAGVALIGLLGVVLSASRSGVPLVLHVLYAVAAAVVLGTAVLVAGRLSGPVAAAGREVADGRHSVVAGDRRASVVLVAGVLVVAAGIAQLVLTGPRTAIDLANTGSGVAAVVQAVLPALALVAWFAATGTRGQPRAAKLGRLTAGVLALSVLAAALMAVLPLPSPAPEPGRPGLRSVALGDNRLAVLVVPMRPGPNLVHVGTGSVDRGTADQHGTVTLPAAPTLTVSADPSSDTAGVTLTARPGAPGTWAVVDIPAGTGRLRLSGSGTTADIPVDVGTAPVGLDEQAALTGPDGPECVSAALAALLAGGWDVDLGRSWVSWCPARALTGADAGSLRDAVDFLANRGTTGIQLVADDSARGRAAADFVRGEAVRRQLRITTTPVAGDAVIVVSGWARAEAALETITRANSPVTAGGIVLAPWLLNAEVLRAAPVEILPLTFSPQDPEALRYAITVATVFPREVPSSSGYLRWAAIRGVPSADRATFYSAAAVFVPMGTDIVGTNDGTTWYAGGAITAVRRPLRTPLAERPLETRPVEARPVETRPVEARPVEVLPRDIGGAGRGGPRGPAPR